MQSTNSKYGTPYLATRHVLSFRSGKQYHVYFRFCLDEVSKLIISSHPTTYPLDPNPSHLMQAISPALMSLFTHISSHKAFFPIAFKQARVTQLIKKMTLDTSLFKSYRPVFLLPFIVGHHQNCTPLVLSLTSQVAPSGCLGEEKYPNHIKWSLEFLRDQFLGPSSSLYTPHH